MTSTKGWISRIWLYGSIGNSHNLPTILSGGITTLKLAVPRIKSKSKKVGFSMNMIKGKPLKMRKVIGKGMKCPQKATPGQILYIFRAVKKVLKILFVLKPVVQGTQSI